MAKNKQRHKNRGKYTKVIVIGNFVHEEQLNLYKYILDKYLHGQADDLINVSTKNLPDHEALKVLEAEDYNPPTIRVEDILQ